MIIIHYLGQKGGGAQYTRHLILGFKNNKIDVHSQFSAFNEVQEVKNDKNEHVLPIPRSIKALLKKPTILFDLYKQCFSLRRNNPEAVWLISMVSPFDLILLPFWIMIHSKLVLVIHDWNWRPGISRFGVLLTHLIAYIADKKIVLSKSVKNELLKNYEQWGTKIFLSEHGPFLYERVERLQKMKGLRIFHFGRIDPSKGIDKFLSLAFELEKKGCLEIAEIWGAGDLSPYNEGIQKLSKIRIENRWIHESEIPQIFASPGILVAMYNHASQSGVVPLSIHMGIPVLISNIEGLVEQIQRNQNGWIAEESIEKTATMIIEKPIHISPNEYNPWNHIALNIWEWLKIPS